MTDPRPVPATPAGRPGRLRRLVVAATLVLTVAIVVLVGWSIVAPSRTGIAGLVAVVLPITLLVAILATVVSPLARRRQAIVLLAGAAAIAALVAPRITGLLPGSIPSVAHAPSRGPTVRLVTYNTYVFDGSPPDQLITSLVSQAPAIVALQELASDRAAVLESDPAIRAAYPYRQLRVTGAFGGLSLLSSYPIEVEPPVEGVSLIEATAEVDGQRLAVLAAHALPPLTLAPFPFQPQRRDVMLAAFRERLMAWTADGDPTVLMGDLNTTDRELVFADLAAGLVDVHATIGSGPGHTWGLPPWPVRLPPLLRIDHMLLSTELVPLGTGVWCGASDSDHCLLWSTVGLPGAGSVADELGEAVEDEVGG